jgi:hypothetical protein
MNNEKIKTFLPIFNGLYETLVGDIIDSNEEREIEYHNEENGTDLTYDDFEWNHEKIRKDICVASCAVVETMIQDYLGTPCTIEFEKLISPRYYNFDNDAIDCIIDIDTTAIIEYCKENETAFSEYIKERYTSCDGFCSSWSNDHKEWLVMLNEETNQDHTIGTVLNFILENEIEDSSMELYYGLSDKDICIEFELAKNEKNEN